MTMFVRVLGEADKAGALAEAIGAAVEGRADGRVFEVVPEAFRAVPTAPFAYWVSDRVRELFRTLPPFEGEGRTARVGLQTSDDFRFVRAWWEVPPDRILDGRRGPDWRSSLQSFQAWCRQQTHADARWVSFAKGGEYSPFYADPFLVADWSCDGDGMKAFAERTPGTTHWSRNLRNTDQYFRPGLTWPRRTGGLSFRVLSPAAIFADKGPAGFAAEEKDLLVVSAIINSAAFGLLVSLQLAREQLAQSFEVGIIQQTPVPRDMPPGLGDLALEAVATKRATASWAELDHGFVLPALLSVPGATLAERLTAAEAALGERHTRLAAIQAEIDRLAFDAYGFSEEDRRVALDAARSPVGEASDVPDDGGGDVDEGEVPPSGVTLDPFTAVSALLSWAVGCAFGRFDVRLATGERQAPPLPDPFDPLPVCSPGMLQGPDGLPSRETPAGYPIEIPWDGLLVDDEGHPADLVGRVRAVLEIVFGDRAEAIEQEACEILQAPSLRAWLRDPQGFFAHHLSRYSKSRRKAPIYWPLATAPGSYTVWLNCHRLSRDTLYKVLNDQVKPRLEAEERRLQGLRAQTGASPTASQRKDLEAHESHVAELAAFREEVARIAPLWNPDLDDGVIINFAPLWRLVPQHRAWQKDVKECWDKLVAGEYDWAHLAMHLWPERVVPKCATDRSLAIAHGIEDAFWAEDASGKWKPRPVPAAEVQRLIAERTSPTVKAALDSLLSAPAPGGGGAGRRGRSRGRKTNGGR